jgi:hypothetical protein
VVGIVPDHICHKTHAPGLADHTHNKHVQTKPLQCFCEPPVCKTTLCFLAVGGVLENSSGGQRRQVTALKTRKVSGNKFLIIEGVSQQAFEQRKG